MRASLFIILVAISMLIIPSSYGADDAVEHEAKRIFGNVMSPFCPGRLLNDCPSGSAHELKEKIKTKLRNGALPAEVEEELYQIYGEEVRATPRFSEFGMAAWLAPPLILFLGVGLVFWWLRRTRGASVEVKLPELDPETIRRIESELR